MIKKNGPKLKHNGIQKLSIFNKIATQKNWILKKQINRHIKYLLFRG